MIEMTRAQCIVCRENKLLMVQHHYRDETWWCLPGGGGEEGETLEQAALRELQEECCVSGTLLRQTSRWGASTEYDTVTYLVEIGDQTPRLGTDPEAPEMDPFLVDVRWRTLDEVCERDRAFLWAAGLMGIETFSAKVFAWGDEISYPGMPAVTRVSGTASP